MRYDYTGAAALVDEYYDLLVDPWELDENEKRQERREFMRNITRGDKKLYTDYARQCIIDYRPIEDAKSRCYDFEYERQIESLIDKIDSFGGIKK